VLGLFVLNCPGHGVTLPDRHFLLPLKAWGNEMAKDLTALAIASLLRAPPAARRETPDGRQRGLFFVVQPSGRASWALRYRFDGRPCKLTLGSFPDLDLKAAREAAGGALAEIARGGDPALAKRQAKAASHRPAERELVENIVERFVERHAKRHTRPKTARETERLLKKEVVGKWRGRALADITKADVHELLDAIADRGAPVVANRTLSAFRKLCAWAEERAIILLSPCNRVKKPSPERSRDRVLSDAELKAFLHSCDAAGPLFGPLFKLLALTGQRRGEVAGMSWREIDLETRRWTIPASRTKNGIEHTVPLSQQALAILTALPRINSKDSLVFTTTGQSPPVNFALPQDRVAAAMRADIGNEVPPWVLHDLRRSAATGMARLGIDLPIIEKVLNHTSGSFAGIVKTYQRHSFADEKRAALDAWGRHVERLVTDAKAGNVVNLTLDRAS
jgi:integrase